MDSVRAITPQQRQAAQEERQRERSELIRRQRMSDEETAREEEERREAFISNALRRINTSLAEGRTACIYATHHVGVQYSVFGKIGGTPFSASSLMELGWDGWELVGTVPATTGIPLTNGPSGHKSYAGGIGGLVEGMHILLRFPVTQRMIDSRPEAVVSLLEQLYEAKASLSTVKHQTPSMESGHTPPQAGGGGSGGFVAFGYSRTTIIESDDGDDGGGDFDFE